ncbi:hypothetical protein QZH41_012196 [Actinostola sp. cb2023]|nr:hypothetical protein QZH41_012196 [Actinostola sp. cb2023]
MADVEQENGDQDLCIFTVRSLSLGNDESGKSTLISKLRGKEDEINKGHGLEYTYLDVHDEELDDYTRLNVWILDGDARNKTLLKYVLTPKNVNDSVVVLVVDSSRPWAMLDSLHSWTEVLREHMHSLKLTPTQLNEMEERIVKQFQEYVDPDEAGEENKRRSGSGLKDEEKVLLPLEENVLVDNLGLPVVVVVSKTDCMLSLEKDRDYREEHFDFIQQHIRRYCLKRILEVTPHFIDDEGPSQLLQKNPPSVSAGIARQQPDITKPRSPGSPATRMTDRRQSGGVAPASGRPKVDSIKTPPGAGAATNEGVLANFFNSLLNKKTGASPGSPQGSRVPSARSDAAAELDRMNRSKKLVSQSGGGEDTGNKS